MSKEIGSKVKKIVADHLGVDEEKVTDKNRHKYTWVNGEWRNEE